MGFWKLLSFEAKQAFLEGVNRALLGYETISAPWVGEDYKSEPTQADKPSPKSSHDRTTLLRTLQKAYPENKGYRISFVANTNSMEPLLDDSDVVISESLEGQYRDARLHREPLGKGQIVIYESSSGPIIHTLKDQTTFLGKPAWIIKGHNNFLPDLAKVTEDKIIARCFLIAYGRTVREGD